MKLTAALRTTLVTLLLVQMIPETGAQNASDRDADEILQRYLVMPDVPEIGVDPGQRTGRMARFWALQRLGTASNALPTVISALPAITNSWQKAELADMLGRHVQTTESAAALTELLKDRDEGVRGAALHGLRLMACRIDRGGRQGTQAEPAHEPKVEGLVPAIISAANDVSPKVRFSAMFALADTREPKAIAEIRKHLHDSDQDVRFHAACLLTEVHDDSGMAELKEALGRAHRSGPKDQVRFCLEAENVLVSLERITGQSFGDIPMNPMLSRDSNKGREYEEKYRQLIDAWVKWFDAPENAAKR